MNVAVNALEFVAEVCVIMIAAIAAGSAIGNAVLAAYFKHKTQYMNAMIEDAAKHGRAIDQVTGRIQ